MTARPSPDLFAGANTSRDHMVAKTTTPSQMRPDGREDFDARVHALCTRIWPGRSFVPALAIAADITVRQAQRIFNREQGFSLDVFRKLTRDKAHGEQFLRLFMDGCEADYWIEMGQERQITALKKQRKALEKQLRELDGVLAP